VIARIEAAMVLAYMKELLAGERGRRFGPSLVCCSLR
jgi:hypothetical protein